MYKSQNLRKNRASTPFHYYSVTTVSHQRKAIFNSIEVSQIITNNMNKLDNEQASKTICFVLMPDHIHWLFQLQDKLPLFRTIQYFKGRCAREIKIITPDVHKIWQKGYFEHCVRDEKDLIKQARYIVANPLRAGLVKKIGDYPYWNCIYL